ncbi:MAG: PA2779 family protein [Rhodospirillales bacterium]
MFFSQSVLKRIAICVIAAFTLAITPAIPVAAGMISNEQVAEQRSAADARLTVQDFMARDDVRQQFEGLGVDPQEAEQRVAALSDAEVRELAQKIETAPAGEGAIGALIGAGLIIFLVLLITDMLGFTHVFGFTNKGSANPS